MARRHDRNKSDKENLPLSSMKDEPDSAAGQSYVSLRTVELPGKGEERQLLGVPSALHPLLEEAPTTMFPLQLRTDPATNEPTQSETTHSVLESLKILEAKINAIMQNFGQQLESPDGECLELQREMKKLFEATLKQKDDFTQLNETINRQRQMLQKLEAAFRNGKFLKPNQTGSETRTIEAVQCVEDVCRFGEQPVVYLLRGCHEFHRRMSDGGGADTISIPDPVNTGSRLLLGRQDFPQLLLQSSTVDRLIDSRFQAGPHRLQHSLLPPTEVGAVGETRDRSNKKCPICNIIFPESETLDIIQLHINGHFCD